MKAQVQAKKRWIGGVLENLERLEVMDWEENIQDCDY